MSTVAPVGARRARFAAGSVVREAVAPWTVCGLVVLLVPLLVGSQSGRFVATTALLYALLAVSWNVTLGLAGIFNFAHIALFALGAYASAIATTRWGLSPWLGLPLGSVVAVIGSIVVFVPVVRFRGIYVALITFVFAQLLYYLVVTQTDFTGGTQGKVGLPQYTLDGYLFLLDGKLGYYYTAAALFLVALGATLLLVRSTYGRSIVALRDNEVYAVSRGVPAFRQQLLAFMWSAAIAGATGALYAHFVGVASPELFGFGYITLVLSMIFLGGVNSVFGPVLGAVVLTWLSDRLKENGEWRFIVPSLLILLVLWFFPSGLAGAAVLARERVARLRRRSIRPLDPPPVSRSEDAAHADPVVTRGPGTR